MTLYDSQREEEESKNNACEIVLLSEQQSCLMSVTQWELQRSVGLTSRAILPRLCQVDDSRAGLKLFGALSRIGFRGALVALSRHFVCLCLGQPLP